MDHEQLTLLQYGEAFTNIANRPGDLTNKQRSMQRTHKCSVQMHCQQKSCVERLLRCSSVKGEQIQDSCMIKSEFLMSSLCLLSPGGTQPCSCFIVSVNASSEGSPSTDLHNKLKFTAMGCSASARDVEMANAQTILSIFLHNSAPSHMHSDSSNLRQLRPVCRS